MKKIFSISRLFFLAALSLVALPQMCSANFAVPYLTNNIPFFAAVLFLGVWMMETISLKKKFNENPQRAFKVSFLINLVTTVLGAIVLLIFSFITEIAPRATQFIDFIGPFFNLFPANIIGLILGVIALLIIPFILTVVIECLLLRLFYKQKFWRQLFKQSFLMNLYSYIFLAVVFIIDTLSLSSMLVVVLIFAYFLRRLFFTIFNKERRWEKKAEIFFFIAVILIAGFLLTNFIMEASIPRPSKALDSRIKSAISQARTIMISYNSKNGDYNGFNTFSEGMNPLAAEVTNNCKIGSVDCRLIVVHTNDPYTTSCVYSALNNKIDGKMAWYCADSTGKSGTAITDPGGAVYCQSANAVCPPVKDFD